MELRGLHLLMTYQCTYECDHCFVWGSPSQRGTMTLAQVRGLLDQATDLGTIEEVAFEGGEPFLFYGTLLESVREAKRRGFATEIVTNAYWAISPEDARAVLRPFVEAGLDFVSVSHDALHGTEGDDSQAAVAEQAARDLGVAVAPIRVDSPGPAATGAGGGGEAATQGRSVRYRGRAALRLTPGLGRRPWQDLVSCPHEDLADPGRVHVDPFGNVHVCQGLCIGNAWKKPLAAIVSGYDPRAHPIVGPLLDGGPAALARTRGVPHDAEYVDECHFCYDLRSRLRPGHPDLLAPDQVFGPPDESKGSG